MGTLAGNYYGGIVKDGLVLMLDAAKKDSYDRLGTTWRDISWNGNNGTLTNFSSPSPQTIWNGDNGGSIIFDGTNDYVDLGSITTGNTLMLSNGLFTISAYIKKNSGGNTFQRIVDKSTNVGALNGYAIWVDSQQLGYSVSNNNNWRTNSTTSVFLNQWNNVCIISNGTSITSYVNGVEFIGSFYNGSYNNPPNVTANLRIGTWYIPSDRMFIGNISQVLIYNKPLSPSEVLQNYNATKGRYL